MVVILYPAAITLPYTPGDLPFFVLLPVLLLTSGFFSGSETALFSLSSQHRLRFTQRSMIGWMLDNLLHDRQMLLITLMFGNMTVNVGYFVISSALLLKLDPVHHGGYLIVGTLATLILIIVFGEVLPKMIANLSPSRWVQVTLLPLYGVHRAIWPLRVVLRSVVIAPLGRLIAPAQTPPALSRDELEALVDVSRRRGVIDPSEEQVLREVVELSQLNVRQIMVPRVDMQAVNIAEGPEAVQQRIEQRRVTKIPVYRDSLDQVLGIVHAREFLLARGADSSLQLDRLIREALFVPEFQRVDQLLQEMRKSSKHAAIVVDEYGGTSGLVTLKDIVERIVGEVDFDSHGEEEAEPEAEALADGRWRVSGQLPIRDWAEMLGEANLPSRVATVGGLVTSLLGRVPQAGDKVQLGNVRMTVEAMQDNRVRTVVLALDSDSESAGRPKGSDDATRGKEP